MKRLLILLISLSLVAGCTTINVTADNGARVDIRTDRNIDTLPIRAEGNTIPVAGLP